MAPKITRQQRRATKSRIRRENRQGSGGPPRTESTTRNNQDSTQVEQSHHAASTCMSLFTLMGPPDFQGHGSRGTREATSGEGGSYGSWRRADFRSAFGSWRVRPGPVKGPGTKVLPGSASPRTRVAGCFERWCFRWRFVGSQLRL